MDDNPLSEDNNKSILNETQPETAPPDAEAFSMQARKDQFLGGASDQRVISKDSRVLQFVDKFKQVDLESDGRFLVTISKRDGQSASFMRIPERSIDRISQVSIFGFDNEGLLRITGPIAEKILAREGTESTDQEKSQNFEDITEQFSGVTDEQGRGSEIVRIMPGMNGEQQRMEKNLKMNLLNVQIDMKASTGLVDEFDRFGNPQKSAVGAREALAKATSQTK